MLLNSLRKAGETRPVDGFFARVRMPLRIARDLAADAFVGPLDRALGQSGMGRVTGHATTIDDLGEPVTLTIDLSLVSDAPRALDFVAEVLEQLDAPRGSVAGNAECPDLRRFGRSEGLGLYLLRADADEEGRLDVLEACTDALDGAGIYQGSHDVADRTAMYFYGESFNRMRSAITFVMTHDPRCRNAYARRLN